MPDLKSGETTEVKGSGKKPYVLRNIGGVYDCSCTAWRMQSLPIDVRTCKHLVKLRGAQLECDRVGYEALPTATKRTFKKTSGAVSVKVSVPTLIEKAAEAKKPAVKKETAPDLLLAHTWDNEENLAGWWISEKMDGVRAYWNGTDFISRLGNKFHAPKWFKKGLPSTPLDGELWIGRGKFSETISIVRRQNAGVEWKKVRYLVFDTCDGAQAFEERAVALETWYNAAKPKYVEVVEHEECEGLDHITEYLEKVTEAGGEGLMLRKPGSLYEGCRSHTLLKVKKFFDTEALVISHVPGRGRHKGRLGAVRVRMRDGTEFKVGTGFSDAQREDPPIIGSVITFRYQERATKTGVPRFPSFVGERVDVEW